MNQKSSPEFEALNTEDNAIIPVYSKLGINQYRNLPNIGSSGYMSSVLQVIAHIPELSLCFEVGRKVIADTGRNPAMLRGRDSDGTLHNRLCSEITTMIALVNTPGYKIGSGIMYRILDACNALNPIWNNEANDASSFYEFLIDVLGIVGDRSNPIPERDLWEAQENGKRIRRAAHRPEEVLNFEHRYAVENDHQILSLASHVDRHWNAHRESGNLSFVTDLATLQITHTFQCEMWKCPALERLFAYTSTCKLMFPQNIMKDEAIPLRRLTISSFPRRYSIPIGESDAAQDIDVPKTCPLESNHSWKPETMSIKTSRVTYASPLVVFEIYRSQPESEPLLNLVSHYAEFDMSLMSPVRILSKVEVGVKSPRYEHLDGEGLADCYELVAIVAYSLQKYHYTSFVKFDGHWVYFDDLNAGHAEPRDPFEDWPVDEGFTQSMLFYRRMGSTKYLNEILGEYNMSIQKAKQGPELDEAIFDMLMDCQNTAIESLGGLALNMVTSLTEIKSAEQLSPSGFSETEPSEAQAARSTPPPITQQPLRRPSRTGNIWKSLIRTVRSKRGRKESNDDDIEE